MPDNNKNQPPMKDPMPEEGAMDQSQDWMEGEIPSWVLMKKYYKLKAKIAKLEGMMEVMMHMSGSHGMHGNANCSCGCNGCMGGDCQCSCGYCSK